MLQLQRETWRQNAQNASAKWQKKNRKKTHTQIRVFVFICVSRFPLELSFESAPRGKIPCIWARRQMVYARCPMPDPRSPMLCGLLTTQSSWHCASTILPRAFKRAFLCLLPVSCYLCLLLLLLLCFFSRSLFVRRLSIVRARRLFSCCLPSRRVRN